tara:strand:- start:3298 stop:3648 length:351 start_codon:yes stop_codon:yes gene_type:complete
MTNVPKSLSVTSLNDWLKSDSDNPIIIDVRENNEIDIAYLNFVDHYIPMSKVSLDYVYSQIGSYSNKEFVIICHRGIRSFSFARWLLENKIVTEVWNLEGGIEDWSIHIDSNIPRY